MPSTKYYISLITISFVFQFQIIFGQNLLDGVSPSNISQWEHKGEGKWVIKISTETESLKGIPPVNKVYWRPKNKSSKGSLRSEVFTIDSSFQVFDIAGSWGKNSIGNLEFNRLRLVSHPDGKILRETVTNNYPYLTTERWATHNLIGRNVYLEIFSPAVYTFLGDSLQWLALENYRQVGEQIKSNYSIIDMQAVNIDEDASLVYCRSIPFLSINHQFRKGTIRKIENNRETIPLNILAEKLFLLGMINHGWEHGVAHWSEHPELQKNRDDQNYIGNNIGTIEIKYEDGENDSIPMIVGSTVWFASHWAHGASHEVSIPTQEPFASRPELNKILRNSLTVYEDTNSSSFASEYKHFYLAVKPRSKKIKSIVIKDELNTRGTPIVFGITFTGNEGGNTHSFKNVKVDPNDISKYYDVENPVDVKKDSEKLARALYTSKADLLEKPDMMELPVDLNATSIRFIGGKEADWLTNIWTANLLQIHSKFDAETGYFRETGEDCPWYGGYSGIGTWNIQGVYPAAYSRTSDHFVTLALRHIDNPLRETSYVDFCDYWLYFYRSNRDPEKGPPNDNLDITRYPKDAPPHWSMELDKPPTTGGLLQVNEIYGDEEMDGHASTIIGRWNAWRLKGGNSNKWLTEKRDSIFGKSRWESTKDATEFICWMMDYTGMDLVYSEGEFTGWGGIVNNFALVPKGMNKETDPAKIKKNYANSNMYEPYPNFACMTALKCAAEMAVSVGDEKFAEKWNSYANTIREAMIRQLISGDYKNMTWRISPYSILTTFQDRLVQTFFSLYGEGLDSRYWDQEMLELTKNTFEEHMQMPYGYSPALAMGYGQGWLTHAALLLDEMDDAGKLLINTAKYSYDKNMNYVDEKRGIDWRKWMWIVPEGVNILPDGSWHRINDLSNGANQGPVMHAIEACAGVDDINPKSIRILPRIPSPLEGISVKNHTVLISEKGKLIKAKIDFVYKKDQLFSLKSDKKIPELSIRFGPYENRNQFINLLNIAEERGYETELDDIGTFKGKKAIWVWIKELKDVNNIDIDL